MTRLEGANVDMLRWVGDEGHMVLWHTEPAMGWMVCWEQSIEKTVEFAFAYVTDVANLNRAIQPPRAWFPQSMTIRGILNRKLFAEYVIVGHTDQGITMNPKT
jgi:hypothetical protein